MNTQLDHIGMPEPTADILDRIRYLVKFSRRTQSQFSELIGIDPSNLSKILSGRMGVTEAFVNRLVVNLGVSKSWLTDGYGLPFSKESNNHIACRVDAAATVAATAEAQGAPVYNIDVTAGCVELSRMFTDERIIGYLNLPNVNPEYPIIRVTGDSMTPRIKHGSYVSIRQIKDISTIAWGQIYVVVLDDYRFVKYVRRHKDKDYVILHSENPNYDDIEVRRSDIRNLFIVEAIFDYDIIA